MKHLGSLSLYKPHFPEAARRAAIEVLSTSEIASGPWVSRFEERLKGYLGNSNLTTMGDGSTAISICLHLAGVRPDDEVIACPMACLATNAPIRAVLATPKWCDIDPGTGTLCCADLGNCLTQRTKAILVYHWGGNPADLAPICAFARQHGLAVVDDAGEALGSEYQGRKIGNTGTDFTVFSFYPNRHITTIDGAAVTFASSKQSGRARYFKRYGIDLSRFRTSDGEIDPNCDIPETGWSSYLNNVAASIGCVQMESLSEIVKRRIANGEYYDTALSGLAGVTVLRKPPGSRASSWVYTFLAERRQELAQKLREKGIQTSALHCRNDRYTGFGSRQRDLPGVTLFSNHCLSIPSGWWVQKEDREYVVGQIREGW
jgi:dTDP-4-amino-4,6-dideoxygalactose transaminase